MLNGIDISHWQPASVSATVDYDFAIIKATEGNGYTDPICDKHYQNAKRRGKLRGVYHFSREDLHPGKAGAVKEAAYFARETKGYQRDGDCLFVLDHECKNMTATWALEFAKEFQRLTGFKVVIYGSRAAICKPAYLIMTGNPLWVAAYGTNATTNGYAPNRKPGTISPWQIVTLYQYTSKGRLPGYAGNLDLDVFYGTANTWKLLAAKVS